MHDLRKKALLESSKTVSRKARSKPESLRSSPKGSPINSPSHSRAGSRVNSRPGSQYGSDDEAEDDDDDGLTASTSSEFGEDGGQDTSAWADRLKDHITELQDRKHTWIEGREKALAAYRHILRHRYAEQQIEGSVEEIAAILLKSIKSGSSNGERILAIQALSVTILTSPSDHIWGQVQQTLKWVAESLESEDVKMEAIQALGVATVYGGADDVATEELLEFLLETIESDGQNLEADDSCPVVAAALQTWGFVATFVDNLTDHAEQAMDAFIEQLDSSDPDVQTNAGTNIALLFEAARKYEEGTEEPLNLQYNQHKILTRMTEIVRHSSKTVSKKHRRRVRATFASIVTSLERGKGPGYSAVRRQQFADVLEEDLTDNHEYGYREKVRVGNSYLVVDTWSLQVRIEMFKTILGGGVGLHLTENPVIEESLGEVHFEQVPPPDSKVRKKAKKLKDFGASLDDEL